MCSLEIFNVFINKQKNPYKDKFVMRFKRKLSDWFVVYDVRPYWNLIGQNEDITLSFTGQALSIDKISQETSGPAS